MTDDDKRARHGLNPDRPPIAHLIHHRPELGDVGPMAQMAGLAVSAA